MIFKNFFTPKKPHVALIWKMQDGNFILEFFGTKPNQKHSFEKVSKEIGLQKIKELNFTESKTLWKNLFNNATKENKALLNSTSCYFNNK